MSAVVTPESRSLQLVFQVGYDPISGDIETKKRTYPNINLNATPQNMLDFAKKIVSLQQHEIIKTNIKDESLLAEEI